MQITDYDKKEKRKDMTQGELTERVIIAATDQDGLDIVCYILEFMTRKGVDIQEAAREAASEYCKTKDGREMWERNCHNFNWGDFIHVPNEICEKHGFCRLPDDQSEVIDVDFNEALVNEYGLDITGEDDTEEQGITKKEAKALLEEGKSIEDIFEMEMGQDGLIYKADRWEEGDTIIYIPDLSVHDIPIHKALDESEIPDALELFYTGNDFLEISRNEEAAERLFYFVDWQTPSAAYDEGGWDDDDGMEARNWFELITSSLRDYSEGDTWSDGTEILVRTESAADAMADLLETLYRTQRQEVVAVTGYYDPEEDRRSRKEDRYTGWWYVHLD